MKYIFLFAFLAAWFVVRSQALEMDPITVTATIKQVRASETGRNITIIDGSHFQELPVHSLDELLRFVPGVEIQSRGPGGSQSDIVLRGGTFQQVLVILDGMRVNDPNTGHFSGYIPVAPAEIERIEILKGASSAIYGSDAVGGVINIITKTFGRVTRRDTLNLNAGIEAGEYGFRGFDAGLFLKKRKLALSAGVISNQADGIRLRGIDGFFQNTTSSLSAAYSLKNNWNAAYRIAIDNRNFAAQNFYTTYIFDTATERISSLWNQIRISHQSEKHKFDLDAGFRHLEDHYRFTPSSAPNDNRSELFQTLMKYQHQLASDVSFIFGANFQSRSIQSNDRGDHSLAVVSSFVSFSYKPVAGLHLRPSVQWVSIQKLSPEWVPQLDISYRMGQFQWRTGVGKTIRDADFTERYNNYNKPLVSAGSVGNPSLKPERALSYEAGADWFINDFMKISSSVFQRRQRRLIDFSTTTYEDMPRKDNLKPDGIYALARNIAQVNTRGFETDIQFNLGNKPGRRIWGNLGFLWLKSVSSDTIPSFYISSHARILLNQSIFFKFNNLSFSLNGLYKVRNHNTAPAINATISPEYFVLNTRIEYHFFREQIALFSKIGNILNSRYSDLLGSEMPGRWITGGISYRFKSFAGQED